MFVLIQLIKVPFRELLQAKLLKQLRCLHSKRSAHCVYKFVVLTMTRVALTHRVTVSHLSFVT